MSLKLDEDKILEIAAAVRSEENLDGFKVLVGLLGGLENPSETCWQILPFSLAMGPGPVAVNRSLGSFSVQVHPEDCHWFYTEIWCVPEDATAENVLAALSTAMGMLSELVAFVRSTGDRKLSGRPSLSTRLRLAGKADIVAPVFLGAASKLAYESHILEWERGGAAT